MAKKHIIYLGVAGSGKTTLLVRKGLKLIKEVYPRRILYLTYTRETYQHIINKINLLAYKDEIPLKYLYRIDVMTFYSFLLKFAIRPYISLIFPEVQASQIGFHLTNTAKNNKESNQKFYLKKNTLAYYTLKRPGTGMISIRSDRISDLILNQFTHIETTILNLFYNKISKIYSYIFVDEAQDYTGSDLKLLNKFVLRDKIRMFFATDPRQAIFETDKSKSRGKRSKNTLKHILRWKNDKKLRHIIYWDTKALCSSFRIPKKIIPFVNSLFKDIEEYSNLPIITRNADDGFCEIVSIRKSLLKSLSKYKNLKIVQLRYNKNTKIFFPSYMYPTYNFGKSKGLEFDIIIIYPSNNVVSYIKTDENGNPIFEDPTFKIKPQTKYKLYVAITRAKKGAFIILPTTKQFLPAQLTLL